MEKFEKLYTAKSPQVIVVGIYNSYSKHITHEGAKKLLADIEVDAKLLCVKSV